MVLAFLSLVLLSLALVFLGRLGADVIFIIDNMHDDDRAPVPRNPWYHPGCMVFGAVALVLLPVAVLWMRWEFARLRR